MSVVGPWIPFGAAPYDWNRPIRETEIEICVRKFDSDGGMGSVVHSLSWQTKVFAAAGVILLVPSAVYDWSYPGPTPFAAGLELDVPVVQRLVVRKPLFVILG